MGYFNKFKQEDTNSVNQFEYNKILLILTLLLLADKFVRMKVSVFALLISSPLIGFGINILFLYILGIFFFNFTMPVTLTAISNIFPNRERFVFGLTTLALILCAFPSFYEIISGKGSELIIFLIIVISALLIFIGLKEYYKQNIRKN